MFLVSWEQVGKYIGMVRLSIFCLCTSLFSHTC
uniref:Uncharacterized protein n=1 Tax=Rhizophora mucronata TaxID=61149 RepID=A0A2P2K5F8_RHIMU